MKASDKFSDKKTCRKAPELIAECYCWSGVGEGWYPLVEAATAILDGMFGPGSWKPAQIKEKYGTLRFYWDPPTQNLPGDHEARWEAAQRAIGAIEATSAFIDEKTGQPGEVFQDGYWVRTRPLKTITPTPVPTVSPPE